MTDITEEQYREAMDRLAIKLDAPDGATDPDQEIVSDYVEQLQGDPAALLEAQTELLTQKATQDSAALRVIALAVASNFRSDGPGTKKDHEEALEALLALW